MVKKPALKIEGKHGMTKLEMAFAEAAKLPKSEQEAFAEWILQELAAERRWLRSFETAPEKLGSLADEALQEHRSGQTERLDPDQL